MPCIEDLHNISYKDEGVVSICGLSKINGSEPFVVSVDFVEPDPLVVKELPSMGHRLAPISPL